MGGREIANDERVASLYLSSRSRRSGENQSHRIAACPVDVLEWLKTQKRLQTQVQSSLIVSLIVAQQGANDGVGGREHPFTEVQLTAYLKGSTRLLHVPTLAFTKPPSLRPRAPAAQTELLQTLDPLCRYVGAYSQAHRSQEERTLLWIKYAFHGRCGNRFPRGFDGGPRVAFYQRNWSGVSTMADSV